MNFGRRARAAARIGRLLLREGDWDGRRLLTRDAVRQITGDAGLPGHCGMGFWTNADGRYSKLPKDTYYGAGAGDQLLTLVGDRLQECLSPTDTLARHGGDEFIILIEDAENADAVAAIAQRLVDRMRQPFLLAGGREVFIGVSVGISLFPRDGDSTDALTQQADSALYLAKKRGGSTITFYSAGLTRAAHEKLTLEAGCATPWSARNSSCNTSRW